jgi:hypothetical protein
VTFLRCPLCRTVSGHDPAIAATNDDGTADDDDICFACAELEAGMADDYS